MSMQIAPSDRDDPSGLQTRPGTNDAEYLCKIEWLKEAGNRLSDELESTSSALVHSNQLIKRERLKNALAIVYRKLSARYSLLLCKAFYTLLSLSIQGRPSSYRLRSAENSQLKVLRRIESDFRNISVQLRCREQPCAKFENASILQAIFIDSPGSRVFGCRVLSNIAAFLGVRISLGKLNSLPRGRAIKQEKSVRVTASKAAHVPDTTSREEQNNKLSTASARELGRVEQKKNSSLDGHGRRSPIPRTQLAAELDLPNQSASPHLDDLIAENRKLREQLAERQKTCDVLCKRLCALTGRVKPNLSQRRSTVRPKSYSRPKT